MPRRPEQTAADYLAIAVSPVLIMVLVGSLVFFLLEVMYQGQFEGRLRWILFWFVFASVLVARIAIENSKEYASVYGLALGVATALVIFRFVDGFAWGALGLMGVIWWCANKLTWDCTLIDDSVDASGEGLLKRAGLDESEQGSANADGSNNSNGDSVPDDAKPQSAGAFGRWWKRFLENEGERESRPHSPGLWVVYFSLAALPLFGIGQLLIPAGDAAGRRYGFQLLWVYVASGLGLLMLTSFLGLRRYLRQRKLRMPASMTRAWIGMGTMIALGILLICLILPRPYNEYSIGALADKVGSMARQASRFAVVSDGGGEGEGRPLAESDDEDDERDGGAGDAEGQPRGGQSDDGPAGSDGDRQDSDAGEDQDDGPGRDGDSSGGSEQQQDGGQQQSGQREQNQNRRGNADGNREQRQAGDRQQPDDDAAAQGDENQQNEEDQQDEAAGRQSGTSPASATPSPAEQLSQVGDLLEKLGKWIVYGVFAAIILFLLIRNWDRLIGILQQFLNELANLWNSLFGGKAQRPLPDNDSAGEASPGVPLRPFSAFDNPFRTGAAHRVAPAELVQYTFEALQAWAFEQNLGRQPEQTPIEFGQILGERIAALSKLAPQVALLYARVAYADYAPNEQNLAVLERLWQRIDVYNR